MKKLAEKTIHIESVDRRPHGSSPALEPCSAERSSSLLLTSGLARIYGDLSRVIHGEFHSIGRKEMAPRRWVLPVGMNRRATLRLLSSSKRGFVCDAGSSTHHRVWIIMALAPRRLREAGIFVLHGPVLTAFACCGLVYSVRRLKPCNGRRSIRLCPQSVWYWKASKGNGRYGVVCFLRLCRY